MKTNILAAIWFLYLAFWAAALLYDAYTPRSIPFIGHYQSHRTYAVYDASYTALWPFKKWIIRDRSLKSKKGADNER